MAIMANTNESINFSGMQITASEAVEYLKSKDAPRSCPSCGENTWFVSISPGHGKYAFIDTMGGDPAFERIAAVFLVTCNNCGLIHMHGVSSLVTWKMLKEANNA